MSNQVYRKNDYIDPQNSEKYYTIPTPTIGSKYTRTTQQNIVNATPQPVAVAFTSTLYDNPQGYYQYLNDGINFLKSGYYTISSAGVLIGMTGTVSDAKITLSYAPLSYVTGLAQRYMTTVAANSKVSWDFAYTGFFNVGETIAVYLQATVGTNSIHTGVAADGVINPKLDITLLSSTY